jgi:hypothetical protein
MEAEKIITAEVINHHQHGEDDRNEEEDVETNAPLAIR